LRQFLELAPMVGTTLLRRSRSWPSSCAGSFPASRFTTAPCRTNPG